MTADRLPIHPRRCPFRLGYSYGPEINQPDWVDLFSGNNDDRFVLGVAVARAAVRLFSPFESSDIIFGSPLGLRQIVGAQGDKKREFDFLSSIEICILDRADVLRMQNWEHVLEVVGVMNRKPSALTWTWRRNNKKMNMSNKQLKKIKIEG